MFPKIIERERGSMSPKILEFLMWVIPLVVSVIQAMVSVIQAVRQLVVEDVIHNSVDGLCGFVSRELGRLWRFDSQKKPQKIEEELKTQIKEVEAENEVLREKNGAMEKQVVDLQKIEEDLKKKVKEVEAENQMLSRRNQKMQKKVVDLQKIKKELKTKIEEVGAENKVLTENNKAMEKKSNIGEEGGIPFGPWGGNGGSHWAYKVDVAPILQITLAYGAVIDSILITSKSRDGNVIGCSNRFGGSGGPHTATLCIDSSVEQLSTINLTYGDWNGMSLITSLSFYSNRGRHGPYGRGFGSAVSIPIEEGTILAGLHGRCGSYLDAFGVLVAPKVLNSSHKASGSGLPLEEI